MQQLKSHFITSAQEYTEGDVYVFEQHFACEGIRKATLCATALGVYEAQVNGMKAGEDMFAPGYTYYPLNLHTQSYDVTSLLKTGENTLRVLLGQGWYCGRFTCDNKTQIYGEKAAVSWILNVETINGIQVYTSTDDGIAELTSPYSYAGFYDGEIYYAEGNTTHPSYQPAGCKPIRFTGKLPEVLEPTEIPVRLQESLHVQSVTRQGDITILDFGQNFAGVVVIDPAKIQGQSLKLRHGEILNPDGSLYTANLRKAKAELIYHKGTETEKYIPRFTYMGFRYVELSGVEYVDGLVTARALYSEMPRTGHFTAGNPLVQKLYENQVWGQKSNYVEVPTDCPQRDERMGYTGDGQVFALTGSYNFDTEAFWKKFLKDIRYSQAENEEGYVAATIPAQGPAGMGFLSMLGWGNAVTIIPEMLYWQYGTKEHLLNQYDSIRQFVALEIRKMEDKNLWIAPSLGDWLMLGKDVGWMAMHNGPVSNAFVVNDLRVAAMVAGWLGKTEDAQRYTEQLEASRAAYIAEFMEADGRMKDDYQGAYILALKYVLPEGDLRKKAFAHMVAHIRENGMQTGFFATEFILPLLAEGGEVKLAYDLLLQEGCPGWMYQILRGATTTWERWDALRPDGTVNETKMSDDNMVSFNHYAFGSVGEFYYRHILGIKPLAPGYEKIRIQPYADARLGAVSGSYASRAGTIHVGWNIQDESFHLTVETPSATEIHLPDGSLRAVQPGSYVFNCHYAQ